MSQKRFQARPRRKGDALVLSLDQLRSTIASEIPGRQREWAEAVENALASVESALRQHRAAAKDPDGLLSEVDENRPALARQASGLRSDHGDLLAQVLALRKELRRAAEAFQPTTVRSPTTLAGGVPDFGAICQQAKQLVTAVQANNEAETKLVLESVNTDIGVGD
jgi:hypothetical protein